MIPGQAFEYAVFPLHIGATLFHIAKGTKIMARILPVAAKSTNKVV